MLPVIEWSKDKEILQQQIDQVLGRKPQKKPAPRKKYKPKPLGERAKAQRFWINPQREHFISTLPPYVDCAGDDLGPGKLFKRHQDLAINFPHLQLNSPYRRRWLSFDLDQSDAATAHEAAGIAAPNWIVINPANGHAHVDYELSAPITYYANSRWTSINYLADIQHGMTTRLDANMGYFGHLTKNPFHDNWITIPLRENPYSLRELASYLTEDERRRTHKRKGEAEMSGLHRNCSLFDWVRLEIAYPQVARFKRDGASFRDFLNLVFNATLDKNRSEFSGNPLAVSEVAGIAKSIARWTWKHFTAEAFSELQRARGVRAMAKRWAGHTPLHKSKPWEAKNIGRATWYRRQKANG